MNIDWDGKGLPPTGLEVVTDHCGRTFKVKILAYAPKNGKTAVMVEEIESGDNKGCLFAWMAHMCNFRPIKTAEQIAAEKREAAIDALRANAPGIAWQSAAAIYDAGYRKFEIVEEDV